MAGQLDHLDDQLIGAQDRARDVAHAVGDQVEGTAAWRAAIVRASTSWSDVAHLVTQRERVAAELARIDQLDADWTPVGPL